MINFILSLFKKDPAKRVLRERDALYKQAVQLQRNGDLRKYGEVMTRISELENKYTEVMSGSE